MHIGRIILFLGILVPTSGSSVALARLDGAVDADAEASSADTERDAYGDAADADAAEIAPLSPGVASLEKEARQVRSLISEELDTAVDPASLFDVSIADDVAVAVEAERLRMLLHEVDSPKPSPKSPKSRATRADAGARDAEAPLDTQAWSARIDLDRARLAFYELTPEQRHALLAAHEASVVDAGPSEAERREREAEAQKQAALRSAVTARSEAERLAATELARLLDVERAQTARDEALAQQKSEIAKRRDDTIGWQQRALQARSAGASADTTYDDLRRALRSARDALSDALARLGGSPDEVPGPGPDALADLRVEVDTTEARKERARVEAAAVRLTAEEETVRQDRAAQLFDQIDTLNRERLALLSFLSAGKRNAVTGFTAAGWDQAASEVRQLTLIVRYHRHLIGQWLGSLRDPRRAFGDALSGGAVQALEWLIAIGLFTWWRRRSVALVTMFRKRAEQEDRRTKLASPSPATRALAFLEKIHQPLEWLVLVFALDWLLPASIRGVFEVRLVSVFMKWVFGASLVVDVLDAIIGKERGKRPRAEEPDSASLRLRSLRLVARVVVVFGLILVVSSMLVGRGTIYQWVFSTCWVASIPIFLILVRWWQAIVFRRTERIRRPSRVQRWVLSHREGWASFAAATVGAAVLFVSGTVRAVRNWIGRFVITRRALAYLFRRQLGKLGEQTGVVAAISDATFEALGPETHSQTWIANEADEALEKLATRIRARQGGVIAIVGERGMGKTAALDHLRGDAADTLGFDAPSGGTEAIRAKLAALVGLPATAALEESATALASSPSIHALLVDNAHRFVQPVMGGLATFDALLAVASRHTGTTTWVFTLDHVIWQFLERARGARPLFDDVIRLDPWREEEIVALLQSRTAAAGLTPTFAHLLEPLPATADDVDKQEALTQRAADYYRLLWDSATGNPGVALHMWRRSLGVDATGATAVRVSSPLDTADLERLPDSSVFVLRAVLQLAPAHREQIAKSTLLRVTDVADALRYATSRGYLEETNGGYRVTWTWFRAITLFLQRRHLLVIR